MFLELIVTKTNNTVKITKDIPKNMLQNGHKRYCKRQQILSISNRHPISWTNIYLGLPTARALGWENGPIWHLKKKFVQFFLLSIPSPPLKLVHQRKEMKSNRPFWVPCSIMPRCYKKGDPVRISHELTIKRRPSMPLTWAGNREKTQHTFHMSWR